MNEVDELYERINELADELFKSQVYIRELRKVLMETREAWRKTGQPIDDIWERGTAILNN